MKIADIAKDEERAYPCDCCHAVPGMQFFDGYWVCDACQLVIDEQILVELLKGEKK